jgi:hypothetical protein
MADAGKLSIGQLQQAVKNGTIPAYIGIPMMQEKMKQAKQAQPAQAPTEPPIAQQVMAEASGIDQMPSNLPTQSMNDGGIVSFADGGDAEDFDQEEYEDQRDEAEYAQAIEDSLNAAEQGGGRSSVALNTAANTAPVGSSANVNSTPNVEGGIRGVVNQAANKYGLPPELLQRISGSESGHNPRAKNSASSAEGLFQFIPSTWAGMGGKPGEQSDPVKNADLGGKFIRQNAETLKRQLGRNPNYDEVYAAHYFGPGVTAMLKNATPDMPIEQGLRMFNSEKFVPIIMQQNPNLRGKTVGQVMGSLREKMGDGQVSLAEGGIARLNKGGVAHFYGGGTNDTRSEEDKRLDEILNNLASSPEDVGVSSEAPALGQWWNKTAKPYLRGKGTVYEKPEQVNSVVNPTPVNTIPPSAAPRIQSVIAGTSEFPEEQGMGGMFVNPEIKTNSASGVEKLDNDTTSSGSGSSNGSTGTRQKSEYDLIREDIMNQREELKRQKQEDKYMAILQAGLGMMAGTSPNAFANIGQGASAGIAQYGASGKQRAAENAALNKGLITAQRYRSMDEYQRAALADRESGRTADREARSSDKADALTQQDKALMMRTEDNTIAGISRREKQIEDNIKGLFKMDAFGQFEPGQMEKYNQAVAKAKAEDNDLKKYHTRMGALQKSLYNLDYTMPNYGYSAKPANLPSLSDKRYQK